MNSNQLEKTDALAAEIKQILCKIFDCSDNSCWCYSVERYPYFAMTQGLAYLGAKHPREKVLYMENFVKNYLVFGEFSLYDFVSCDSNNIKVTDSKIVHLEKENGFESIKHMIDNFKKIVGMVIDLEEKTE